MVSVDLVQFFFFIHAALFVPLVAILRGDCIGPYRFHSIARLGSIQGAVGSGIYGRPTKQLSGNVFRRQELKAKVNKHC